MTSAIQHISFDVWNTLITPSKEYGKHRTTAIARHFSVTEEEAKQAYKQCKKFLDNTAELVGFGMSVLNNWKLLEKTLGKSGTDLRMIIAECDDLFEKYQPEFTQELKEELIKLKERGFTLSIKSNTNFISGTVLAKVLFNNLKVFNFQHYSDMFEMSKPHYNFYNETFKEVSSDLLERSIYDYVEVNPETILHIGDNMITDGKCSVLNWKFQYVQNPQDLLNKLKNNEIV